MSGVSELKQVLLKRYGENKHLKIDHLDAADFAETGRGIKSDVDFEANEFIISFPNEALITGKRLCQELPELEEQRVKHHLTNELVLVFYLAFYCKDHYPEYYASLPKEFPNYWLYWSKEDWDSLYEDRVLRRKIKEEKRGYHGVMDRVEMSDKEATVMDQNQHFLDPFKLAWAQLNTRTVYLNDQWHDVGKSESNNDSTLNWALAPFLDQFNHHYDAKTVIHDDCDKFAIQVEKKHAKGEQLFISYGEHPDWFLLLEYGFIIGNSNPHNLIEFTNTTVLRDPVTKKMAIQLGCGDGHAISLQGASWSIVRALHLIIMGSWVEKVVYEQFDKWPKSDQNLVLNELGKVVQFERKKFVKISEQIKNRVLKQYYCNQIDLLDQFKKMYLDKKIMAEI